MEPKGEAQTGPRRKATFRPEQRASFCQIKLAVADVMIAIYVETARIKWFAA